MKSRTVPLIWVILAGLSALVISLMALLLASSQYRVRELDIRGDLEGELRRVADILVDRFESKRSAALSEAAEKMKNIGDTGNHLAIMKSLSLRHPVIRQPFLIQPGSSRTLLFPPAHQGIPRPLRIPDRSRADSRVGGVIREGYGFEADRMYVEAIRSFQRALEMNRKPFIEPYILASVARNYRKLKLNLQADMFLLRAIRAFPGDGSGDPDFYFSLLRLRASLSRQTGNLERAAALYADLFEKSQAGEPTKGGNRYAVFRNEAAEYLGRYREERALKPRPDPQRNYLDMSLQWRYHDPADWEAMENGGDGEAEEAESLRRVRTLYAFDGGKARYYDGVKKADFWKRIDGNVGERFFEKIGENGNQIRIALVCVAKGIYFGFSTPVYRCGRGTLTEAGKGLFRKYGLRLNCIPAVEDGRLSTRKDIAVETVIESRLPGAPRLVLESSSPGYMARRVRGEMLWSYALIGLLMLVMSGAGLLLASYLRRERQLVRARHDFLNLAAHTLRTPVTRLALLTESLRSGWIRNEEQRRDYLDSIEREAALMKDMVNHLLDFARMEESVRGYEKRSVDLAAIVEDVVSRFSPGLKNDGFDFEAEVEKGVPVMWLDPRAIEMVVSVLLHNAVKYSAGEKWIRVRVFHHEGKAVIQVTDHGRGIPERDIPRVFEKFYRSAESEVDSSDGSGLGLYMARHAVRAHGGSIRLESSVGKGTEATVILPVTGGEDGTGAGRRRI